MSKDIENQNDAGTTPAFVGNEKLFGHWKNITSNPFTEPNRNKLYRDSEIVVKTMANRFKRNVGSRMDLEDLESSCSLVFESARKSWDGSTPWPIYFAKCAWWSMCTAYRSDYRHTGRWGYVNNNTKQDTTSLNYFRGSYGFSELYNEQAIPDSFSIENHHMAVETLQELESHANPEDQKMWTLYKALVSGTHRGTEECPTGRSGEYMREKAHATARRIINRWRGVYILDIINGPVYLSDVDRH